MPLRGEMLHHANHRRSLAAVLGILVAACGSGGGFDTHVDDPEGGTSLSVQVLWQQPPAGGRAAQDVVYAAGVPGAVRTVRIEVDSDLGGRCCLSVDPRAPELAGRPLVIDGLPAGPLRLAISGYPTGPAPAGGAAATCSSRPVEAGEPCEEGRLETPSFVAAPAAFTAIDGKQARGEIEVPAVPFSIGRVPDVGDEIRTPVALAFAVVDAATGIDAASVTAAVTFDGGPEEALALATVTECEDGDAVRPDCSDGGLLEVGGVLVESDPVGAAGPAAVRILGVNRDDPPRELDFAFPIIATPLQVDLTFRLIDAVTFASVGFDVDYSGVQGEFEGSGAGVTCEGLVGGAIVVFNDDDAVARRLLVRLALIGGAAGPRDLARCRFGDFEAVPAAGEFALTVVDATDPDAEPLNPVPSVIVSSVGAVQ